MSRPPQSCRTWNDLEVQADQNRNVLRRVAVRVDAHVLRFDEEVAELNPATDIPMVEQALVARRCGGQRRARIVQIRVATSRYDRVVVLTRAIRVEIRELVDAAAAEDVDHRVDVALPIEREAPDQIRGTRDQLRARALRAVRVTLAEV